MKTFGFKKKRQQDLIFYSAFIAFPIIQFLVFYVVINFNSIALAFKEYDVFTGYSFAGWQNFKNVFYDISHEAFFAEGIKNSLIYYVVSLVIGFPLGLIFSFYIYKKYLMSDFFKVLLFLPSVISVVVMQILFSNIIDGVIPELNYAKTGELTYGLMSSSDTRFMMLVIFNVWVGFGGAMLYYTGAMSKIPDSLIEAGEIDGTTLFQQFWFIVLPLTWSTCKTLLVISVAGIFTTDLNTYLFFNTGAEYDVYTVGYYLTKLTLTSTNSGYPYISALGLILTIITCSITFLLKWLLEKFTWEDVEF